MNDHDETRAHSLSRRQVLALLAALGVSRDVLATDAVTADPRSYRVVLENDRVRCGRQGDVCRHSAGRSVLHRSPDPFGGDHRRLRHALLHYRVEGR